MAQTATPTPLTNTSLLLYHFSILPSIQQLTEKQGPSLGRGRHSTNLPRREKRLPKCKHGIHVQPFKSRVLQGQRRTKARNTLINSAEPLSASFLLCATFTPLVSGLDTTSTTTNSVFAKKHEKQKNSGSRTADQSNRAWKRFAIRNHTKRQNQGHKPHNNYHASPTTFMILIDPPSPIG